MLWVADPANVVAHEDQAVSRRFVTEGVQHSTHLHTKEISKPARRALSQRHTSLTMCHNTFDVDWYPVALVVSSVVPFCARLGAAKAPTEIRQIFWGPNLTQIFSTDDVTSATGHQSTSNILWHIARLLAPAPANYVPLRALC